MGVLTLGWNREALGVEGFSLGREGTVLRASCLAATLRFWQGTLEKQLEA